MKHLPLWKICGLWLALALVGCGKGPLPGPGPSDVAEVKSTPAVVPHPLRQRLAESLPAAAADPRHALIAANLARLDGLTLPEGRHLLVDVAGQRLYMLDGDLVEDSMAVVVGERRHPTPLIATEITRLIARPYWHVPLDLAQQRVAPSVVRHGPRWLAARGMETLDPDIDAPTPLSASAIDWKAVAAGRAEARVRQKPGPGNMMGAMKFELDNDLGIYLHDTPERHLFRASDRARSAGCIRVADWQRLAEWLWGGPLPDSGSAAEQAFNLPQPVPVRIVYLTLSPLASEGWLPPGELRAQADPYRLDRDVPAAA